MTVNLVCTAACYNGEEVSFCKPLVSAHFEVIRDASRDYHTLKNLKRLSHLKEAVKRLSYLKEPKETITP